MKCIVSVLCLMVYVAHSQVMWQLKSTTNQKWFLQTADEFDGNSLNLSIWNNAFPWSPVAMNLDLIYKPENLVFNGGTVSLISKKEKTIRRLNDWEIDKNYLKKHKKSIPSNNEFSFDYSGGAFSSMRKYKYGFFEMRFKANKETGMWPAFWLYGGDPNEEIDFYEGKGERDNQIHLDVHCPDGCEDYKGGFLNLKKNWGAWIKLNQSLADGWNIISGEWQEDGVRFFVNGQAVAFFKGQFKTSQYLIINSAVAKDNEAFNPGPNEKTVFPNSFMIDYVRVWSKEDTTSHIKDNYKLFENSPKTITENDLYSAEPKGKVNFIYNKKALTPEQGTITLLPVFYNKYSLSLQGKNLGKIQVDIMDQSDKKVAGFGFENMEYYIMDLSNLPTGGYNISIKVLNQILTHHIPVINPAKIGEQ